MKDFQMETDFNNYIRAIAREEYLIVIAVGDTIGGRVGTEGYKSLRSLGLQLLGSKEDGSYDHWKGYVAILYKGILQYENLEQLDMTVEYETILDGIRLEICSSPYRSANRASIVVNGEEYAVNHRGMNIVVIDTEDGSVIDSVAFDTWADGRPCFRNEGERKIVVAPCKRDERNLLQVNEARERLRLSKIIENFDQFKKIKVRIIQWAGYQLWNSMESVATEFAKDDRYDLMVIVERKGADGDRLLKRITSLGIKAVRMSEYSVRQDKPDVEIFSHWWGFREVDCESVKLRYIVPATLISGHLYSENITTAELEKIHKYRINRMFVDKNLFEELRFDKEISSITELSGNPKFDLIYEKTKMGKSLPDEWKKLESKTVFLWAFDHNWWLKSSSADLYFKEMIQAARSDEKIGLIIRPHMEFINEMLTRGIWSGEDMEALKYFCKRSANIIWDDTIDYGNSYSVADAVMTDVNCGIVISALPLDKPVAILQRYDGYRCKPHYPDVVDAHYNINSIDELYSFFRMVKEGEDPQKDLRYNLCKKYVSHFDGFIGRRIRESIERDIQKAGLRGCE